jgi:thymidylate synthase ThyX
MSKVNIEAKIVADSINKQGNRLTSMLLTMPRILLSEFNTHRSFSRNSASSRAIPFKKMCESIENNPFVPVRWQKNHSGMQGTEYFEEENGSWNTPSNFEGIWLSARDWMISKGKSLHQEDGRGVTKQIVNRLLEPFMYHKVLVTSTDFENFFALRAEGQAEIHIQELAYKMLDVYNQNEPTKLDEGQWHLPYGDQIDEGKLEKLFYALYGKNMTDDSLLREAKVKIAVARCARTSYTTIESELKHDYEKDIKLCDGLKNNGHASPCEHTAKAMTDYEYENFTHTYLNEDGEKITEYGWCGNFQGFIQYRKMLKDENKKDARVKKHLVAS